MSSLPDGDVRTDDYMRTDGDVRTRSTTLSRFYVRLYLVDHVLGRVSAPLLRGSLGLVFIWFGALKISNSTPVAELVANTVPFLPAKLFVPALGVFEIVLGLGLLVGRWIPVVVTLMVLHLTGTFLVLVTQPEVAFNHGNPLELTMTGEFVVKNLVLITAGLLLLASRQRQQQRDEDRPLVEAVVEEAPARAV
jgi:putative oxidoreductase